MSSRLSRAGGASTSPVPSSLLSALTTPARVCGASGLSTAMRYGSESLSRSLSTTLHRSVTWIVGSTFEPSLMLSRGSAALLHAVLNSVWNRSSSSPYVRPAATTCARSPSRFDLVTSFSRETSSL